MVSNQNSSILYVKGPCVSIYVLTIPKIFKFMYVLWGWGTLNRELQSVKDGIGRKTGPSPKIRGVKKTHAFIMNFWA